MNTIPKAAPCSTQSFSIKLCIKTVSEKIRFDETTGFMFNSPSSPITPVPPVQSLILTSSSSSSSSQRPLRSTPTRNSQSTNRKSCVTNSHSITSTQLHQHTNTLLQITSSTIAMLNLPVVLALHFYGLDDVHIALPPQLPPCWLDAWSALCCNSHGVADSLIIEP